MKQTLLSVIGTVLFLVHAHTLHSQIRIMPLGDSITEGVLGSSDDTGYRRALYLSLTGAGFSVNFVGSRANGASTDFDRDHEGHSGWRADQIRDNISGWLTTNPADIILLHIGTNDISQGQTASNTVAEVNQILDLIDARSVATVVFLARIVNRNDSKNSITTDYNTKLQALADTRITDGDHIIVVNQETALNYPSDLADAVHPNDAGYTKMAQCWLAALSEYLRPETELITQAKVDVNFPRSRAVVNLSVLPPGGGTITMTRHEQLPGAPPTFPAPPAGAGYVPVWYEITSTMPQNSFGAQITLDVDGVAGFSSATRLLCYAVGASAWIPMPGTYNSGDRTFAFTASHFSDFAFANPSGNTYELYVDAVPADTLANTIYPNTTWGEPTGYEPDDWRWTGSQPLTVYLAPQSGSVFGMCNLTIEWDSTVMHLEEVDWGSAGIPNGLFGSGQSYPTTSLYNQLGNAGRVTLNCSRLDNTNFTTAAGDYIAALNFTLLQPGCSPVSVVAADVRSYVAGQPPAEVFVTPHLSQVKAYLGDFAGSGDETTGDGRIDFEDLVVWSYSYWSGTPGYGPGMQYYKMKFDIGPTQSGMMTSLPVVDGQINFEDLVIFSLAYGEYNAFHLPKDVAPSSEGMTIAAGTASMSNGETRIPVLLSGDVKDVRALSMTVSAKFGKLLGVDKGTLLQGCSTPVMLMSRGLNSQACVDLAIAGVDARGLSGEGELVVLRFAGSASGNVTRAEGRSSANRPLLIEVAAADKEIPALFALDQNYPNPFNPTTTIQYALPHRSHVTLNVYNPLGQHVATLVNSNINAGHHTVPFEASNLASGVYYYRLAAGSFVETRKLLLIR